MSHIKIMWLISLMIIILEIMKNIFLKNNNKKISKSKLKLIKNLDIFKCFWYIVF